MNFEWDDKKDQSNIKKHGVSFGQAISIFSGIVLSCEDNRHDYGEVREISTGETNGQIVLAVIHTDRNEVTRIISARIANRAERKAYYEHCKKITK
jgi:uncharacterized DUF497 family protein